LELVINTGGLNVGGSPNSTIGGGSTVFNGTTGYAYAKSNTMTGANFTVTGWVNVAALPTVQGTDPYPFSTFFYYGMIGVGIRNGGCLGSASECLTTIYDGPAWEPTSYQLPLTQWIFVAMSVSSSGLAELYVNGNEVASVSSSFYTSHHLTIGASFPYGVDTPGRFLNGSLAQVAYFNSVLTPSQVSQLYASSS
jgi:hypothetical protein